MYNIEQPDPSGAKDGAMIEFFVGLVIVALILIVSLTNKGDLKRYQELKNKRRFSGKRLPPDELAELDRLARKYPWY